MGSSEDGSVSTLTASFILKNDTENTVTNKINIIFNVDFFINNKINTPIYIIILKLMHHELSSLHFCAVACTDGVRVRARAIKKAAC